MNDSIRQTVENATVQIIKDGGRTDSQGVLVPGGFVLTAAHCVSFSVEGGMTLGEIFIEDLQTVVGNIRAQVIAIEPVSDVAVLASIDSQASLDDADRFEEFCESVKPVSVSFDDVAPESSVPVFVYSHEKKWVSGTAEMYAVKPAEMWPNWSDRVKRGTSGSPIVNQIGELVGVLSKAHSDNEPSGAAGWFPHLKQTVPPWILNAIRGE